MIKNLIVSGCSYTSNYQHTPWPEYVRDHFNITNFINLAVPGAGNFYISNSMINCLISEKLNPAETLVIIMWSGVSRKDILISNQYFELLHPACKVKKYNQHYAFSGGQIGLWCEEKNPMASFLTPLFKNYYKAIDNHTLAHETLSNMINTKEFLTAHGFNYKFLSYVNYWQDTTDWIGGNPDFSITYYAKDNVLLNNLGKHWIWVNDKKDCLYEWAKDNNTLDLHKHPTAAGHQRFAKEIVVPHLTEYFI
jgi:hypothetical protein